MASFPCMPRVLEQDSYLVLWLNQSTCIRTGKRRPTRTGNKERNSCDNLCVVCFRVVCCIQVYECKLPVCCINGLPYKYNECNAIRIQEYLLYWILACTCITLHSCCTVQISTLACAVMVGWVDFSKL